jgi:radical SAM superfamily enzyme YgiQ (UPF0313 family)
VDSKLLKVLKKAGCYSTHLSVDSTSEHVRERILGRRMRKVDITDTLKMIRSYGINTWVNFMLAAPESNLDDDLASIALSKESGVTYVSYSTTVPMEGTVLYDYCVNAKMIDPENHISDMTGCTEQSTLKCFSEKEKKVRFNIYLLGAVIAKLPFPLGKLALCLIKLIPPNPVFRKIREVFYQYSIENKIFKLHNKPA